MQQRQPQLKRRLSNDTATLNAAHRLRSSPSIQRPSRKFFVIVSALFTGNRAFTIK
jgi:hypothetical protein